MNLFKQEKEMNGNNAQFHETNINVFLQVLRFFSMCQYEKSKCSFSKQILSSPIDNFCCMHVCGLAIENCHG